MMNFFREKSKALCIIFNVLNIAIALIFIIFLYIQQQHFGQPGFKFLNFLTAAKTISPFGLTIQILACSMIFFSGFLLFLDIFVRKNVVGIVLNSIIFVFISICIILCWYGMATNNEEFLPVIYNADYPEEGNAYGEYYQVTIFGLYVWINYGITMCLSIASACSCNDIIKPKIKENKFKVKSVRVKG